MPRSYVPPLAVAALLLAASARSAEPVQGKAVFDGAKPACKGCHTDARNPLAKAGATNTTAELTAWVRTPEEMMAKKDRKGLMPAFGPDKISDAELEALVAYLATMK
jgi:mono/diheme cytochrome c family protein